jgi:hypothetical protein
MKRKLLLSLVVLAACICSWACNTGGVGNTTGKTVTGEISKPPGPPPLPPPPKTDQ